MPPLNVHGMEALTAGIELLPVPYTVPSGSGIREVHGVDPARDGPRYRAPLAYVEICPVEGEKPGTQINGVIRHKKVFVETVPNSRRFVKRSVKNKRHEAVEYVRSVITNPKNAFEDSLQTS